VPPNPVPGSFTGVIGATVGGGPLFALPGWTTGAVVAVAFLLGLGVLVGTDGTDVSVGATVAVAIATGTAVLVAVATGTGVLVGGTGVLVTGTTVLVGVLVAVAVLVAVGTGVLTMTTGMFGDGTVTEAEAIVVVTGLVVVSSAVFRNVTPLPTKPTEKEHPATEPTGIPPATVHVTL
jgi:hypothetical protein